MIDVIVIVILSVAVVGTIVLSIVNKKKGKTSCGCDCSKCSSCCKNNENTGNTNK